MEEIKDEMLPDTIDTLPLEKETKEIVSNILEAHTLDELKQLTNAFSVNQAKKNAVRIIKLNTLLDDVHEQAIERFNKRPGEISNKELLDYMKVVQEQINNSSNIVQNIDVKPMIQINNQKNEININTTSKDLLNEQGRERVLNAVNSLLALMKQAKDDNNKVIELNEEGEQE